MTQETALRRIGIFFRKLYRAVSGPVEMDVPPAPAPVEAKPELAANIHVNVTRAVVTVAFGKHAPIQTPKDGGKLTSRLVTILMKRAGIDDPHLKMLVVIQIYSILAQGKPYREFEKWCLDEDQPTSFRTLDPGWHELIFWCGWGVMSNQDDDDVCERDEVFPYRMVYSYACRLPKHAQLDKFAARAEDTVWSMLQPPLGWACGCKIMPLLNCDIEVTEDAKLPGEPRLDPKLLKSCWNWSTQSPREALKILGD